MNPTTKRIITNKKEIVKENLTLWLDGKDFSNASPTLWYDKSGMLNNATLSGFAYTTVSGSDENGGVMFDGVDDYGSIPYTSILAPTTQITVSAVINFDYIDTTSRSIISKTEGGGYAFFLNNALVGVGNASFVTYKNLTYRSAKISVTGITGFHQLSGTDDGRYTRLYLDGYLVDTVDAGNVYSLTYTQNNPLIVGGEPDNTQ